MRAAVIGAGIIGLACAEELLRAGHDVLLFDPTPAQGATHAAAGMLAPAGEAWHGEEALLALGVASAALWPQYAARLIDASGVDIGFRTTGSVLVGRDHDDLRVVGRTAQVLGDQGIRFEHLDRRELLGHEPTLNPRVAGGLLLPEDHSVDPRATAAALVRLVGDRLLRRSATPHEDGVVLGDGTRVPVDVVVLARGAARGGAQGAAQGAAGEAAQRAAGGADRDSRHVRPVKGETIRVRAVDPPAHVVRGRVYGDPVYVVPRAGGEVVVGATEEEHAGDPRPTVGGVARLLDAARELLPGLETAEILDLTARHRPGTPDNGPLIGPLAGAAGACRQICATGHYRGGVLLAPLTALAVRAYVDGDDVPAEVRCFVPDRFDERSA